MGKPILFTNAHLPLSHFKGEVSLLAQDGQILFSGDYQQAREFETATITEINLAGKTVLPGLCDFHLHLANFAEKLDAVDCETDSLTECLARVAEKAESTPAGEWILGYGWNHNAWQPAGYGTAAQLDAVSAGHPIFLHAKSLHAAWVNSMAMRITGIDRNTPDPEGGIILRDANGDPTGILLEHAAFIASDLLPEPNVEQTAQKILQAQTYLNSLGFTAVHDFDRFESAEALLLLAERGQLKLKVTKNLPSEEVEKVIAGNWRQKLTRPPFIQPGWLKDFADGALGPQSAAMMEPYEGSQNRGMLLLKASDLAKLGLQAAFAGWPLSVHAIGDLAVREVLDGFSLLRQLERANGLPALPHRIEHVQIIQPTDRRRMHDLNIIASVQPIHATSDYLTADHHWGKRCENAYAYQSLFQEGINVRFGSDTPVESPNPFLGIHAAVTRQRQNGQPTRGWYPQQRVTLLQAIQAYTQPLPGSYKADLLGVGMPADFIVLDQDPFTSDQSELTDLKPRMTVVAGEVVFER
ncbi:MAG: amidohydrolase [Anaerolineaceae bacterium]